MEIDDLMKCTLPSANRTLAPPGCRLLTFSNDPSSQPEEVVKLQQANEYWVELGGTTVLMSVKPPSFAAHSALSVVLVEPFTAQRVQGGLLAGIHVGEDHIIVPDVVESRWGSRLSR